MPSPTAASPVADRIAALDWPARTAERDDRGDARTPPGYRAEEGRDKRPQKALGHDGTRDGVPGQPQDCLSRRGHGARGWLARHDIEPMEDELPDG